MTDFNPVRAYSPSNACPVCNYPLDLFLEMDDTVTAKCGACGNQYDVTAAPDGGPRLTEKPVQAPEGSTYRGDDVEALARRLAALLGQFHGRAWLEARLSKTERATLSRLVD